ncbi:hypothetical protein DL770_004663 [Monosporascus sp. CRB-9-2]|nr:hypothetical protein DL770_004663 [Monosporascus sp. CRB-9-2]
MTRLRSLIAFAYLGTSIAAAQEIVYVTDLSIFTLLAPCAASAVSYNVQSQTYDSCPEAVEELQSCVCTKNNNFASVSREVSSSVSYSCGGTASDDQASAASVLSAYCNQADITPFPEPAEPVSEYIVDLSAYQELAPCAMSGVSRALASMTYDMCLGDASHLATCACMKNQNSLVVSQGINSNVSSVITSDVQYWCESTATEDISSALQVFDYYCSAARAEVSPQGVTDIETAPPTAEIGNTIFSGPTQTSESGFDNWGFEDPSGESSGESSGGRPNGRPAASNTGAIVGAVVGAAVGLALIGAGAFFLWRRSRKAKGAVAANGDVHTGTGKPELDGTVVAVAPVSPPNFSPSPSGSKAQHPPRTDNVSPVSTAQKASEHARSPATQASELHAQSPAPQMSELHGQNTLPPQTVNAYYPASGQPVHEAPVQHPTQVHEMHAQPEATWQSGPIMQYHEMDGTPYQWRAQ